MYKDLKEDLSELKGDFDSLSKQNKVEIRN